MSATAISLIVFACLFAGGLLGTWLRTALPKHHLGEELTPQNDAQRSLQSQALSLAFNIGQTRWLMFEQGGRSIPTPFLVVLVCWLTIIFLSFGVYAPLNATVVIVLFVCALSIAGAIFLILELDQPFAGWIKIPSTPLRKALTG